MKNKSDQPVSRFQQKVYEALLQIPRGRVTTYKLLAIAIGCKSAQAVGQALRRNPYAPEVPCHRVIKSDLTIGGFSGKNKGIEIKRKMELLKKEGVYFSSGILIDSELLFSGHGQ